MILKLLKVIRDTRSLCQRGAPGFDFWGTIFALPLGLGDARLIPHDRSNNLSRSFIFLG